MIAAVKQKCLSFVLTVYDKLMLKNKQTPDLRLPVKPGEPRLGNKDAKTEVVMYGDYEDPKCRKAFREIEILLGKYPEHFQFIWRHFPQNKIHQKSQKAAELAVAAGTQDKFWEIHRLLIAEGNKLSFTDLVAYARETGIYSKALYNALTNNTYAWDVRDSMTSGVESGVKKLPAVFINGRLIPGDADLTILEAEILE